MAYFKVSAWNPKGDSQFIETLLWTTFFAPNWDACETLILPGFMERLSKEGYRLRGITLLAMALGKESRYYMEVEEAKEFGDVISAEFDLFFQGKVKIGVSGQARSN